MEHISEVDTVPTHFITSVHQFVVTLPPSFGKMTLLQCTDIAAVSTRILTVVSEAEDLTCPISTAFLAFVLWVPINAIVALRGQSQSQNCNCHTQHSEKDAEVYTLNNGVDRKFYQLFPIKLL